MQPNQPSKEQLLREALPIIQQILHKEFTMIPADSHPSLLKATLLAYERTLRTAQEKKLNLAAFSRQLLREQAHVWLLRNGLTREQTASEQWIWDKNEGGLRAYLRRFAFRINDVVDDLISQTFHDFFRNMREEKPLKTLLQAYLAKIVKLKALHELRGERKSDKDGNRVYFRPWEQTFIDVDDAEFGSLRMPIPTEVEDEYSMKLVINEESIIVLTATLLHFLRECFEQLGPKRQEAIRLRFRFLSDADLQNMNMKEVTDFINQKMNSAEIAEALGFANAQVVNTRTNENVGRLHDCMKQKILNGASQ